jgi:hypothetical protein
MLPQLKRRQCCPVFHLLQVSRFLSGLTVICSLLTASYCPSVRPSNVSALLGDDLTPVGQATNLCLEGARAAPLRFDLPL